ncbi:7268_t:CDS:2, partial [Paraglomus brasilianum]
MPPTKPTPTAVTQSNDSFPPEKTEQTHVHDVYEAIATHFSATRYKPWPVVEDFLKSMAVGSIGADIGCGNGKYLGVNKDVIVIGSDRSPTLCQIAHERGFDILVGDALNLPFRSNSFDFVISIAVIHHFTTEERRLAAIKELHRIALPESKILTYVWALEQSSRRQFSPDHQDIFVPWSMQDQGVVTGKVYQRYYHLFRKGELEGLIRQIDNTHIIESGYDKDN